MEFRSPLYFYFRIRVKIPGPVSQDPGQDVPFGGGDTYNINLGFRLGATH